MRCVLACAHVCCDTFCGVMEQIWLSAFYEASSDLVELAVDYTIFGPLQKI